MEDLVILFYFLLILKNLQILDKICSRFVHLDEMIEQLFDQSSDSIISTDQNSKYSSTSVRTKTHFFHGKMHEQTLNQSTIDLVKLS